VFFSAEKPIKTRQDSWTKTSCIRGKLSHNEMSCMSNTKKFNQNNSILCNTKHKMQYAERY